MTELIDKYAQLVGRLVAHTVRGDLKWTGVRGVPPSAPTTFSADLRGWRYRLLPIETLTDPSTRLHAAITGNKYLLEGQRSETGEVFVIPPSRAVDLLAETATRPSTDVLDAALDDLA